MAKIIGPSSSVAKPIKTLVDYLMAAANQKWEIDLNKALRLAGQRQDPVLAAFVGLAWCYPCQKLEAEVFETMKFLTWSYGRVVLLRLDYSPTPSAVSEEMKQLLQTYNIQGYPSILGLNAQGNEIGRVVGYGAGTGPEAWIDSFESEMGW